MGQSLCAFVISYVFLFLPGLSPSHRRRPWLLTMHGRGAWILYSWVCCSCFVSLARRGLPVCTGRRWQLLVVALFVVLRWSEPQAEKSIVTGISINKAAVCSDLGKGSLSHPFFSGCRGGGRKDGGVDRSNCCQAAVSLKLFSGWPWFWPWRLGWRLSELGFGQDLSPCGSEVHLVPVLQTRPLLPLCIGGCQGDGQSVERGWSSSTRRLVLSTSSSAPDDGRWRLLLFLFFERSNSGRWPALQSSSVNSLVEGRPQSLSSRLYGRQSLLLLGGFGL